MKSICSLLLICAFMGTGAFAQDTTTLTLEKAIETALTNNIDVRQRQLQLAAARVDHSESKANLLPNVNASINHGINQGRSIDPFTNTYVNEEIRYATYGAGASLLLFNGLSQQHSIRQAHFAYDASKLEMQQARDNLSLNIMLAYLQVLSNEDRLEMAGMQVEVTQQQLKRLQTLHQQGAISPPMIAELNGQLKGEELALVNAGQELENAKLALAQLMNVPYNKAMRLKPIGMEMLMADQQIPAAEEVYTQAMGQLSLVKAAQYRKRSAEAGVQAARGFYYPRLFLNGNLNSNYSSAATFNGEEIYYNDQLRNNIFSSISLSLQIPIFNTFSAHYGVKRAKLTLQNVNLAEESTRQQLRQDVETAQLNLTNARERYRILQQQLEAFAEAFRAAEVRFNSGVDTPVEYLIAKNNLDRTRTNLLMAKYDYVLRMKILSFYSGR